jgi:hypothetical protein
VSGPSGVKMSGALRVDPASLLARGPEPRRRARLQQRDEPRPRRAARGEPAAHAAARSPLADRRGVETTTPAVTSSPTSTSSPTPSPAVMALPGPRRLRHQVPAAWPTKASAPCSRRTAATSTPRPASSSGC